ncbi:zinc-binding alcohol dehydrogenase family protein [Mycolicibacter terrae]|uniref:Alcohol dehydrogenase n=2 Tax=Mycolicibacter TaxID=1073531 RepID=A0A1A2NYP9_MYCSD|nr:MULTISPECIES: zinc-binding alcohol dehydrogenase family protein [Mycolicibacter]OBH20208.1 alcohol dehydrogenase [Mycolicibacter sinensis]OBI25092.1 alcohol dehydrogenase [Mycolicibacter sinensis]RRR48192.1 zinc-binding alcohol dehydrogenase family protein [Mycolicibacter terrae]
MKAAILQKVGGVPAVGEFDEPDGKVVQVRLAGCNPVDLARASGKMGTPEIPSVVGQEGIGSTADGARVYFNSPPDPFGSWAQRCRIEPGLTFPVSDAVDDDLAVAMGIAGLAAWLPLTRHASVENGESVLVLGATGIVGRIAVQAAKLLGAGRVVGAGRNPEALELVGELGADATVTLGKGNDAEALKSEAGDGYDVVIDTVYGDPFLAALDATASGATLITIGQGAGPTADVSFRSLMGRTHVGHFNNAMPPDVLRTGYEELTRHAAQGRIRVETRRYSLDDAADAWRAQADGPHVKLAIVP